MSYPQFSRAKQLQAVASYHCVVLQNEFTIMQNALLHMCYALVQMCCELVQMCCELVHMCCKLVHMFCACLNSARVTKRKNARLYKRVFMDQWN
jgi:hypothetical protein